MRLAVYTDYTYRRGGEKIYAERAFALFLDGLAVELDRLVIVGKVDRGPGPMRYPLSPATSFCELPYYTSLVRPWQALSAMLGSLRVFWRALPGVDGVWLLGPHPLAVGFAVLAWMRGRSVALGVRQDFPRYARARHPQRRWVHHAADALDWAWRSIGRRCRTVTVGSDLSRGYDPARTLPIAVSLISEEDIVGPELADDRDYEDGELRVLSVGRLEQEKNPLLLADVIERLQHADSRWRLRICGEGPMEAELCARLSELGVTDHVDLLGYVPHDRLRELYRKSHGLLHVSWTEGVPQVLFEAFAARLPVVATDVGGVATIARGRSVLIEPGDAQQAADGLRRIQHSPSLRAELTERGAELARASTLEREARRVAIFLGQANQHAAGSRHAERSESTTNMPVSR